jgi:hypothetical protein
MEHFIHNENLKLWRRQLEETTDAQKRAVLVGLIAEEEAREAHVLRSKGQQGKR